MRTSHTSNLAADAVEEVPKAAVITDRVTYAVTYVITLGVLVLEWITGLAGAGWTDTWWAA